MNNKIIHAALAKLSNRQIFHGNWEESKLEGMAKDFEEPLTTFDNLIVVYANYEYESYDGSSEVYFIEDGKWYIVKASHCSCNGLEGQWKPELTTPEALLMMPKLPDAVRADLQGAQLQ